MKLKLIASIAIVLIAVTAAFAAPTTVTGVLTDDMCTGKHMMPGKTDADCVRACVKDGAKFVVVAGGKTYILKGKEDKLNALAGKKIVVTGELQGKTLTVAEVKAAQ